MDKKKILIISITRQDSDPRVIRQINFLKDDYDIYCCGISNNIISPENFYAVSLNSNSLNIKITSGLLILLRMYGQTEDFILRQKLTIHINKNLIPEFDVIIANDMESIPVAFRIFRAKKVMADLHEYAPGEFEDKLYWKLINRNYIIYQCKKYFPLLDAATTVCLSISETYKNNFGIHPEVITNASDYYEMEPGPVNDVIKIIHHGAAISSRKIELMIESAKLLDKRFRFDLMLIPNELAYYNELKNLIRNHDNIRIIEPVPFNEIIPFCNSYDIGLFILPPVNINYKYALPNKFFEFIQSRLAIVSGPSPEMKNYISEYDLGITTDTFEPEEISKKINKLSSVLIKSFKNNSHRHAKELSSQGNKKLLNNLVTKLLTN